MAVVNDAPSMTHDMIANAAARWLVSFGGCVDARVSVPEINALFDAAGLYGNGRLAVVEAKRTRSDWRTCVRKGQLEKYATFCHVLYVAAPTGLIDWTELPRGVGLLEASMLTNKARCKVRRHADWIDHLVPPFVGRYVLNGRPVPKAK